MVPRSTVNSARQEELRINLIDDFNPAFAIELLLKRSNEFFGLQEVVFAGLCGFVLRPYSQPTIRRFMIRQAYIELQELEHRFKLLFADARSAEILTRLIAVDPAFFDVLYYPLTANLGIPYGPARPNVSILLKTIGDMGIAMTVMHIYHFHFDNLAGQPKYNAASANIAYHIMQNPAAGFPGTKSVRDSIRRARYQPSAPFAYSASTLKTTKGRTLLYDIQTLQARFGTHKRFIATWMDRVAYVRDILAGCSSNIEYKKLHAVIGQRSARSFAVPDMASSTKSVIAQSFERKPRRKR